MWTPFFLILLIFRGIDSVATPSDKFSGHYSICSSIAIDLRWNVHFLRPTRVFGNIFPTVKDMPPKPSPKPSEGATASPPATTGPNLK